MPTSLAGGALLRFRQGRVFPSRGAVAAVTALRCVDDAKLRVGGVRVT